MERFRRIAQAFSATRKADPRLVSLLAGVGGGILVLCVVLGFVTDTLWLGIVAGILLGLFGMIVVFGRRASATAIAQIEGRPGAAAAVLQSMRGPWRVTPAIGVTRKQDFVHLVVGRPGVILVGEGAPARIGQLLRQEHRRMKRVVGSTPVHEVSVGGGTGQVPLGSLQVHMTKLPRTLKAKEVGPLDTRLAALGGQQLPLPKGPLPRPGKRMR